MAEPKARYDEKMVAGNQTIQDDDYSGSNGAESHHLGNILSIDSSYHLQRRLTLRQIQLFALGGAIGTSVFVSIAYGLIGSGPGNLFLAFTLYSFIMALVNNCEAELVTYMPVNAAFIRQASKWVDDALGFMVGWNYFIYIALGVPLEITSVSLIMTFWTDKIPVWAVCLICIVLYFLINVFAVNVYGESEFWLSSGKLLLLIIVFSFTFITMCGGNPQHDAYGFRNWSTPGAFLAYIAKGNLGKFEGFLAAFWRASWTIVGPDYISIVAGEAKNPRRTLKSAFKTMYWRFGLLFIGSAFFISIVLPSNDPTLNGVLGGNLSGGGTAAASPYIIAMENMGISVLPHICNALLLTSIFSAGNSYVYAATRSLHGLACQGQAPAFLRKCSAQGVPIYAFVVTICFSFLSFLQVNSSASTVLNWMVDITTAGGLINFITMLITYLCFYRALKAQGIDRRTLPYRGWGQPYCAIFALILLIMILFSYGYTSFMPWSVGDFFTYYALLILAPILFIGWKIVKKTKFVKPEEMDLIWEGPALDAYEATLTADDQVGFWRETIDMARGRRIRHSTNA